MPLLKPLEAHILSGSIEHDPARFKDRLAAPKHDAPLAPAPAYFNDDQVSIWNEVAAQCVPGSMTLADSILMEVIVTLLYKFRRGELNGIGQQLLVSTLIQCGMSPIARGKLQPVKKDITNNQFNVILNQKS
jgi:hypothetical protein